MNDSPLNLGVALTYEQLTAGRTVDVHLVATLDAQQRESDQIRPPMSVIFVLDVSGSMTGPPIEHVTLSVDKLVGLLEPHDRVGIVAFSSKATEVAALAPVTAEHLALIRRRVRRLVANGTTHIEDGLRTARAMLPERERHERQVILLLSDGAPNEGRATPSELGELVREFRPDVGLSTLGYGAHHNEDVLGRMAEAGGGLYHFVPDPRECDYEFARAIGQQGDIVAEGIELAFRPRAGVDIVRAIGRSRTRVGADGLIVDMPDQAAGGQSVAVLHLSVHVPTELGPFDLLDVTLRYRRAGRDKSLTLRAPVSAYAAAQIGPPDTAALRRVMLARADSSRAEARAQADRGQFESAAASLRAVISEIRGVPGFIEGDGSPLGEACELLLDEAMAMERRPSQEAYRAFKRGSMTINVSTQNTDASQIRKLSEVSQKIIVDIVGNFPRAELIGISGKVAGRRFPLAADQVLGRTPTADIQVTDAAVSRKHARIYAHKGLFLIADLHSTNPTFVNEEPVSAPVELCEGDLVRLGDCVLRYCLR